MMFSVCMRTAWLRLAAIPALLSFSIAPSASQQMREPPGAALHTAHEPFAIETFGVFRNMMLSGDFTPKVQLDAAMAKHPTTGVGAVASARGEISIYDGKLIVSYGKPAAPLEATSEQAALLTMGSAAGWQSMQVERDIAPEDVEAYIAAAAKAHGLDLDKSFPFELRGSVGPYAMHVNAAPIDGPHGMGLPMAVTVDKSGAQIDGMVAGLYVSAELMGVATHGGERIHAHWVASDLQSTAHLDRWGLKAGSVLLLPK